MSFVLGEMGAKLAFGVGVHVPVAHMDLSTRRGLRQFRVDRLRPHRAGVVISVAQVCLQR